ncbi:MAG TPA: SGNH/GDSL hydrolase family protein [Deltaproteobacteria bacterium]|jgi:lysophospholipase L1-like esterase|nr:SGNH/GDSL hydrolase family protein [Deltaproteobacteria bacterium]HQI01367.1 SGNH/GDSL hydrolase family protein [Deltaproteobacteria bacterium]
MDEGTGRRIVIRGGSIASGYGVTRGYADILEGRYGERGIEVVNRSRRGDNSFDGIRTFHEDITPYRPDILLIHFGEDDAFFPVYRSEYKENLVHMVKLARELFSPVVCLLTSHTFDDPYDMDALQIFYRASREVAVDLACELIPVHTFWAGYLLDTGLKNSDLVLSDTRYPNEHGHRVFAEAVSRRLDRVIAGRRSL